MTTTTTDPATQTPQATPPRIAALCPDLAEAEAAYQLRCAAVVEADHSLHSAETALSSARSVLYQARLNSAVVLGEALLDSLVDPPCVGAEEDECCAVLSLLWVHTALHVRLLLLDDARTAYNRACSLNADVPDADIVALSEHRECCVNAVMQAADRLHDSNKHIEALYGGPGLVCAARRALDVLATRDQELVEACRELLAADAVQEGPEGPVAVQEGPEGPVAVQEGPEGPVERFCAIVDEMVDIVDDIASAAAVLRSKSDEVDALVVSVLDALANHGGLLTSLGGFVGMYQGKADLQGTRVRVLHKLIEHLDMLEYLDRLIAPILPSYDSDVVVDIVDAALVACADDIVAWAAGLCGVGDAEGAVAVELGEVWPSDGTLLACGPCRGRNPWCSYEGCHYKG